MWVWSHNSGLMRHHKSSVVENIKLLLFCASLARFRELQSKLLTTQQRFFFCRYDRKAWEDSAWWRRESLGTWNIINKKLPTKLLIAAILTKFIHVEFVALYLNVLAVLWLWGMERCLPFSGNISVIIHIILNTHIHSATGCVSVSLLRH